MERSYEIKEELSNTVDYLSAFVESARELSGFDADQIMKHLKDLGETIEELSEEEGEDE